MAVQASKAEPGLVHINKASHMEQLSSGAPTNAICSLKGIETPLAPGGLSGELSGGPCGMEQQLALVQASYMVRSASGTSLSLQLEWSLQ
jgi:hypothetical protein